MSRLGLLGPITLLGREIRDHLDARSLPLSEVRLLAGDEGELGAIVEIGHRPVLVEAAELERVADLDLLVSCASDFAAAEPALAFLGPAATAVLVQSRAEGLPIVAGINSDSAQQARRLVSPHPAVVALAHLLAPLKPLRPIEVLATVIEPASQQGQRGLDEILEQTRALLSFQQREPQDPYPRQLAFNLLPSAGDPAAAGHLATVLGLDGGVSLQFLNAGVFHSVAISLHCRLAEATSQERVSELVAASANLEIASEPAAVGPVATAGRPRTLVGEIQASEQSDGYWFWLVCDNLTQGGAWNAVDIVADVLASTDPETAN